MFYLSLVILNDTAASFKAESQYLLEAYFGKILSFYYSVKDKFKSYLFKDEPNLDFNYIPKSMF